MQERHNLATTKFLKSGENPLPLLESFVQQIRSESSSEWSTHPSFNLLLYHIALINFSIGNIKECVSVLDELLAHTDTIDVVIMTCICLLGIELSIRHGEDKFLPKAESFLQANFPTPESIREQIFPKISDENFLSRITEDIQFHQLRLQVSKSSKLPIEESKPIFERIVESSNISQDSKNRVTLPLKQVIPIANAALLIGDQRYVPILESTTDQFHPALLNNRGVHELLQKRFSSAMLYFSKALNSRTTSELTHPYQQIAYNVGLSLLMKGNPKKAFRFLHATISTMPEFPYLWLRLAECCVMYYKKRVSKLRKEKQYNPVISKRMSTGTRTFIVLPQTDYRLFESYPIDIPDLNLGFAEKCTRNAIALCNDNSKLENVKRSAELLNAFISLELGDGRRAAEMGKAVYTSINVDQQKQFLAKMYAAQGLAMIGDSTEARAILARLPIESNIQKEKEESAIYTVTFSHVYMASHDIKKAQEQLINFQKKAVEAEEFNNRPEVVLTKVALELRSNRTQQAIATLNSFNMKTN
ncbi:CCR4-NOT transcription complex subunit 10 [Histomonas meleagridis]|uniref:CCR4-NOT transcription complex subunit 10 n=1 Tax=Histomonas meleagridis TaxID=135588 RepID=UPI00355A744E|nr:CCR4-NOT transcription complex subunit 10 [Histomonas meleagridis]KAH0798646.1 CCR4-NOT transcription complex subunit 10 [Histomonas meleagridis]